MLAHRKPVPPIKGVAENGILLFVLTLCLNACGTPGGAIISRNEVDQTRRLATSVSPGRPDAPPDGARTDDLRPVTPGWLKTVRYDNVDDESASANGQPAPLAGARIYLPPVHETLLEGHMRTVLTAALRAQGFTVAENAPDDAPDYTDADNARPLTISYGATVLNEFRHGQPPQSRLRFAPPLSDPRRDDRFPNRPPLSDREFDPGYVYFDPNINRQPGSRAAKISVILSRGSQRIWAGYANAEIGHHGRRHVAQSLTRALVRQIGQTADVPNAAFFIGQPSDYLEKPPVSGISAPEITD